METNKTAATTAKSNADSLKKSSNSKSTVKHKKEEPLEQFFIDALKDMYWAEKAIVESLPKMRDAATTEELKEAFEDHELQTRKHISRLEKVFEETGQKAEAKKCEAMAGILKECEEIKNSTPEGTMTRDAALIIAAQKVEHYEIASYGGLVQLALTLNYNKAADLLNKTLAEEEETDEALTDVAESYINFEASREGDEEEESETAAY
ncbi:ferritin-like domain-containing protein [Taibaiella lutea]|uniref:Ferritin-like domain-containing protein n=1 Tax=Taibaiella lutea TaxID=2608001 RepID=A0A5M6CAN5_9BACT|nr:ferritin-like domain-containing protein [Taibaiella lutea]KAA5532237.1 ferritin-like domain-containing protein [Taibaiella lutea]